MEDLKIGGAQFEDVDRIQLNKADLTGVVNFMEQGDFMDVMQRPYRMSSTKKTLYENQYLTTLGESGATFLADFTTAYLPNVTALSYARVPNTLNCINIILPKLKTVTQFFTAQGNCEVIDLTDVTTIENNVFAGTHLSAVIIRGNAVPTLNATGAKANGVTLYVPTAMLSSYQADTAWSTLTGWTFTALEGSAYADPDWFRS